MSLLACVNAGPGITGVKLLHHCGFYLCPPGREVRLPRATYLLGVGSWCWCVFSGCRVTNRNPANVNHFHLLLLLVVIITKISLNDVKLAELVCHRKKAVGCPTWAIPNWRQHCCPWPADIQISGKQEKRLGARHLKVQGWVRSWGVQSCSSLVLAKWLPFICYWPVLDLELIRSSPDKPFGQQQCLSRLGVLWSVRLSCKHQPTFQLVAVGEKFWWNEMAQLGLLEFLNFCGWNQKT